MYRAFSIIVLAFGSEALTTVQRKSPEVTNFDAKSILLQLASSIELTEEKGVNYVVPGNRPTPTLEKRWIAAGALPIIALAVILAYLGDNRKLPKWMGVVGCAAGLYAAHVSYGVLQEYIVTQPYSNPEGQQRQFPSISFLVFSNRLMATVFAAFVVKVVLKKPLGCFGGVEAEGSARLACLLPSLTNVAATWFQYGSLWFVTFPTQMVFKSMKLVPVLFCQQFLMKRPAPIQEWMDAFIITVGVVAFTWFAEADESAGAFTGMQRTFGVLMLLGFLLCDAVTPGLQKRAFANANLDAFQMMFWIGAASSVYAFVMMLCSRQFTNTMAFLAHRPEAVVDVVALSTIATLGQIFIYVTVQKHGPVALSMIMTTRQVWSVLLSCHLFGHKLPGVALGAASMVFSVLLIRTYRSMEQASSGRPLSSSKALQKSGISDTASEYTAPVKGGGSGSVADSEESRSQSQLSAAFGITRGFAKRFSAQAKKAAGKLVK